MRPAGVEALGRAFRPTGRPAPPGTSTFKAVTYNVLADRYSSAQQGYCPAEHLAWESRWPRIRDELRGYGADVLFLQEVERPVFETQLQPLLSPAYSGLYHPRRLPSGLPGPEEGVSLHFKNTTFALLASAAFRFADVAPAVLPEGVASDPLASPLLRVVARREEGAIAVLLQHRATGAQLLAASTHLYWDPCHPDVKVVQAAALCRGIRDFLEGRLGEGAAGRVPIIIGGDFNSLPAKWSTDHFDRVAEGQVVVSGVYQLLTRGRLGPEHQDHPSRRSCGANTPAPSAQGSVDESAAAAPARACTGWRPPHLQRPLGACVLDGHVFDSSGLQLASMHVQALGSEPPLTTRTSTFDGCLDYLFLSRGHFDVTATLEMPYASETWQQHQALHQSSRQQQQQAQRQQRPQWQAGAIAAALQPAAVPGDAFPPAPNAALPSDHIAVGAELVIRM